MTSNVTKGKLNRDTAPSYFIYSNYVRMMTLLLSLLVLIINFIHFELHVQVMNWKCLDENVVYVEEPHRTHI